MCQQSVTPQPDTALQAITTHTVAVNHQQQVLLALKG